METIGFLIAFITAVLGVLINHVMQARDHVRNTKDIIRKELYLAHKEFGYSLSPKIAEVDYENSLIRIKKLHFEMTYDVSKLISIETFVKRVLIYIFIGVGLMILSVVAGYYLPENSAYGPNLTKNTFFVWIPVVIFWGELLLFYLTYKYTEWLKDLEIKYKNLEY